MNGLAVLVAFATVMFIAGALAGVAVERARRRTSLSQRALKRLWIDSPRGRPIALDRPMRMGRRDDH